MRPIASFLCCKHILLVTSTAALLFRDASIVKEKQLIKTVRALQHQAQEERASAECESYFGSSGKVKLQQYSYYILWDATLDVILNANIYNLDVSGLEDILLDRNGEFVSNYTAYLPKYTVLPDVNLEAFANYACEHRIEGDTEIDIYCNSTDLVVEQLPKHAAIHLSTIDDENTKANIVTDLCIYASKRQRHNVQIVADFYKKQGLVHVNEITQSDGQIEQVPTRDDTNTGQATTGKDETDQQTGSTSSYHEGTLTEEAVIQLRNASQTEKDFHQNEGSENRMYMEKQTNQVNNGTQNVHGHPEKKQPNNQESNLKWPLTDCTSYFAEEGGIKRKEYTDYVLKSATLEIVHNAEELNLDVSSLKDLMFDTYGYVRSDFSKYLPEFSVLPEESLEVFSKYACEYVVNHKYLKNYCLSHNASVYDIPQQAVILLYNIENDVEVNTIVENLCTNLSDSWDVVVLAVKDYYSSQKLIEETNVEEDAVDELVGGNNNDVKNYVYQENLENTVAKVPVETEKSEEIIDDKLEEDLIHDENKDDFGHIVPEAAMDHIEHISQHEKDEDEETESDIDIVDIKEDNTVQIEFGSLSPDVHTNQEDWQADEGINLSKTDSPDKNISQVNGETREEIIGSSHEIKPSVFSLWLHFSIDVKGAYISHIKDVLKPELERRVLKHLAAIESGQNPYLLRMLSTSTDGSQGGVELIRVDVLDANSIDCKKHSTKNNCYAVTSVVTIDSKGKSHAIISDKIMYAVEGDQTDILFFSFQEWLSEPRFIDVPSQIHARTNNAVNPRMNNIIFSIFAIFLPAVLVVGSIIDEFWEPWGKL